MQSGFLFKEKYRYIGKKKSFRPIILCELKVPNTILSSKLKFMTYIVLKKIKRKKKKQWIRTKRVRPL